MSMLIGYHKTVGELQVIMEEKLNDNKMTLQAIERNARALSADMRTAPPKRGTVDERPRQMLELQNEGDRIQNQNAWLSGRLKEATMSIEKEPNEKDKKIRLSLNDCLMLGIEPDAEAGQ